MNAYTFQGGPGDKGDKGSPGTVGSVGLKGERVKQFIDGANKLLMCFVLFIGKCGSIRGTRRNRSKSNNI